MHSHTKKIEMCNAWLDLLNIGIIKMGFGFMRVLACEEKSNSSNICLQPFFTSGLSRRMIFLRIAFSGIIYLEYNMHSPVCKLCLLLFFRNEC